VLIAHGRRIRIVEPNARRPFHEKIGELLDADEFEALLVRGLPPQAVAALTALPMVAASFCGTAVSGSIELSLRNDTRRPRGTAGDCRSSSRDGDGAGRPSNRVPDLPRPTNLGNHADNTGCPVVVASLAVVDTVATR